MEERPLDVVNQADAIKKMPDSKIVGDNDKMQLLMKFASGEKQVMHSTKAYEIEGIGCIVQFSSEVKGQPVMSSVFVPGVKIVSDINGGRKLVRM